MSIDTSEYALLAKDSYNDLKKNDKPEIGGVVFLVLGTVSRPSGYQATAYQRVDTGEVVIAHRGTELKKCSLEPLRDGGADLGMVRDGKNSQLDDAMAFTRQIVNDAEADAKEKNRPLTITTTGHSLGGTLAEITAYRFGLRGETFNSYGAADLGYGVPEGGIQVVNHVRATDLVSAASRHFGSVRVYATEQDIDSLDKGRYLDPPSSAHPANPLLSADISAHFIDNFAPEPGKGTSILSAASQARYLAHQQAVDRYRSDVDHDRINIATLLNHIPGTSTGTLQNQVQDALEINAVRSRVEGALYANEINQTLDGLSTNIQSMSQLGAVSAHMVSFAAESVGAVAQRGAETMSQAAQTSGQASQTVMNEIAQVGRKISVFDPLTGTEVALSAQVAGHLAHAAAKTVAQGSHIAGQVVHAATETVSQAVHVSGEFMQAQAQTLAQRLHNAEQVSEGFVRNVDHLAVQAHDAAGDKMAQGYNAARHAAGAMADEAAHNLTALGVEVAQVWQALHHPQVWLAEQTSTAMHGPGTTAAALSGSIVASATAHPSATVPDRELSAQCDRMLAAATRGDWDAFRKDTLAFANLTPGRALLAEAKAGVDRREQLAAQQAEPQQTEIASRAQAVAR